MVLESVDTIKEEMEEIHSPCPEPHEDELVGDCQNCPALIGENLESFNEIDKLIEKIIRNENNDSEAVNDEYLKELKYKLSDERYKKLINTHNSSKEGGCDTWLHKASDASHYASMKILLEAGASPNVTNRWKQLPLHTVVDEGDGCYCHNCNKKNSDCVKLLLEKGSKRDIPDWEGDTPISCSALALMSDCADVLWRYDASIKKQEDSGHTPGELIASYIPNQVKKWFDLAIQQDEIDKIKLNIDFGAVMGRTGEDEVESGFLMCIVNAHRQARETLLLHPLAQSYLHLKWEAVSVLFVLLRIAYLCMALVYTCFIVSFFLYKCPFDHLMKEEDDANATTSIPPDNDDDKENDEKASCETTPWIYTMSGFLIIFVICMVMNEFYEVAQGFGEYRKNPLNVGWWLMIITVTINVIPVYIDVHGHWQYVIAAFGIFMAWGMFMSQLARDPKIGIYVEMLGAIVKEFLLVAITYFALFVGFAMGFAVLFPDNPMFEYVYGFLPIFKSLLILIGETDYETLFHDDENPRVDMLEYSIGAHIIFGGFIIVITILLVNLLIGLTTSDVQELKQRAKLSRTEGLVRQIDLLETLFRKNWIPNSIKNTYVKNCSIENCVKANNEKDLGKKQTTNSSQKDKKENTKIIYTSPYRRTIGPILEGLEPFKIKDTRFPQELREQFVDYVNKDECSKKDTEKSSNNPTGFCDKCQLLINSMLK